MSGADISNLQTERTHPAALGLDQLDGPRILDILHNAQVSAAEAVGAAIPSLDRGAEAMATAIRTGGNLV